MEAGKITKTEWLLLGLTGLFLCILLGLFVHDWQTAPPVETEVQVPQEEILPDLSPLDLNTATAEELATLPGIGAELAGRIVAYREEHGGFSDVEELLQVPGIGPGILEGLRDYVTVGEGQD